MQKSANGLMWDSWTLAESFSKGKNCAMTPE